MKSPVHKRSERLNESLTRHVAMLLQRLVKDPRVAQVTITGSKITEDLRQARIYFTVPEEQIKQAQKGLDSACGFIHRELTRVLEMKFVPKIMFTYDNSFREAARIDALFYRIHEADRDSGNEA